MDGTPTNGETAAQQPLENNANPQVTAPAVNTSDNAEVERLKKEAEQARMRANQLENELKKKSDEEALARQKQLEEKEEYKTLYEQEKAERERIANEATSRELSAQLNAEKSALLSEYPDAVREIAEETGLSLTDVTDEAKAQLKEKLDKINARVGSSAQVGPNNTRTNVNIEPTREEALKTYRETGDKSAISAAINSLSFVKAIKPNE